VLARVRVSYRLLVIVRLPHKVYKINRPSRWQLTRLYCLLKQLREQGFSSEQLDIVFQSIIITRIAYAAPALVALL